MEQVALASAAAAVAWIGIVLNKFCITEATLWTWQQNLFEEGRVKQNAHGTWLYTFVGLEVPQDSIEKYLWLTRELYKKKELLRPQLTSQGLSGEEICSEFVKWDELIPSMLHCSNDVGETLAAGFPQPVWSAQTTANRKPELVLYCQPGQIAITKHINIVIVRGLYEQLNIGGFAKAANINFDTRSTELSEEQSKAVTFRADVVAKATQMATDGPARSVDELEGMRYPNPGIVIHPDAWKIMGSGVTLFNAVSTDVVKNAYIAEMEARFPGINLRRDGAHQSVMRLRRAQLAAARTVTQAQPIAQAEKLALDEPSSGSEEDLEI